MKMINICICIMSLLVTIVNCGELNLELGVEFANQTQKNLLNRLVVIDQIENILVKLLNKDESRLIESKYILDRLRIEVKHIGVEAFNSITVFFFQLNQIVFESKKTHSKLKQLEVRKSVRRPERIRRNVDEISQVGLNFTIQTMEQTQDNFNVLLSSLANLEEQLEKILSEDEQALNEAKAVLDKMKEMLANYEAKMLALIHEAILDLNENQRLQQLLAEIDSNKNSNIKQGGELTANALKRQNIQQLERIFEQQMRVEKNFESIMAHIVSCKHFYNFSSYLLF